ncbi:MAG: hypothetical protein ACYSX0_06920 [Planctomycetota bacterium]
MKVGAALILLAAVASAGDLDVALRNVNRGAGNRLMRLARTAEDAGLARTAVLLRERALLPCPDHPGARDKLGFKKRKGRWSRTAEARAALDRLEDSDEKLAAQYMKEATRVEEWRLGELVRVCRRYASPEQRRQVLLPILERMPRRTDVHEALGHEKIGRDYVRPELIDLVHTMPERVAAWRRCAEALIPLESCSAELPGLEGPLPAYRMEGQVVAVSLGPEATREIAQAVGRSRLLLTRLLGPKAAAAWAHSPVVFLDAKSYAEVLRTLHPDEETFKFYSAFGNYEHAEFYAIRTWSAAGAAERYAHGAAYMTMQELAAPGSREAAGRKDPNANAWLNEGFGYFCGFELFGTGNLSFVSIEESSAKIRLTRPPPAQKTRAACLAWMREQILAGHGHRLHDVCARSLNNLDFLASMEAYSFLRFLFLLDPAAARRFPAALRTQTEGPQVDRTDRALGETFGMGLGELERTWRAFVLEISH